MSGNQLRGGVLVICLIFAAGAVAADPAPTATVKTYRAKEVLGSKILIEGNTAVGTVDDIVFDEAGNLDYLIVENGGKLLTVPWEAAKFDAEKREAVLSLSPSQFKVIPTFTVKTYPSFYTPAYRAEVYKSYNITPRELRRLNNPRR